MKSFWGLVSLVLSLLEGPEFWGFEESLVLSLLEYLQFLAFVSLYALWGVEQFNHGLSLL